MSWHWLRNHLLHQLNDIEHNRSVDESNWTRKNEEICKERRKTNDWGISRRSKRKKIWTGKDEWINETWKMNLSFHPPIDQMSLKRKIFTRYQTNLCQQSTTKPRWLTFTHIISFIFQSKSNKSIQWNWKEESHFEMSMVDCLSRSVCWKESFNILVALIQSSLSIT